MSLPIAPASLGSAFLDEAGFIDIDSYSQSTTTFQ
jgi:hypothetical protein